MYIYVSRCKNIKIKGEKKNKECHVITMATQTDDISIIPSVLTGAAPTRQAGVLLAMG
jgi:hypothetical protein